MSSGPKRGVSSSSTIKSEDQLYWTDDLPLCQLSAVGESTNQVYRKDGSRREGHDFEDRSCHFRVENDIFLYGVFDGHDGCNPATFAAQRMPAELLLGQLNNKITDEEIKEILRLAFVSVERGWMESIDDVLARKARLLLEYPDGVPDNTDVQAKLESIEMKIRGGTTAVLALIVNNRLYVANIGCSRALLCITDDKGTMRVMQLTVDHDLDNKDELQRLASLNVNVSQLQKEGKIGDHHYTRTLGDYSIKSGYKDTPNLSEATTSPIIAEPEVYGGIELGPHCNFLLLFSDGLYKALEDARGTEHVNGEIAAMVASEFEVQSTLNGVSQAVVDQVARIHHDEFIFNSDPDHRERCQQRDDITLLVRNINYTLRHGNTTSSPCAGSGRILSPSQQQQQGGMQPLSLVIPASPTQPVPPPQLFMAAPSNTLTSHLMSSTLSSSNESSVGDHHFRQSSLSGLQSLPLDSDGRLAAYVDFTALNNALNKMTDEERAALELKPGYETIPEEETETSSPDQETKKTVDDTDAPEVPSKETNVNKNSKQDEDMGFEIINELINENPQT